MEAIRGTWSIGGIALGPIRICPRMGRTHTAGPTLSPAEELNRFEAAQRFRGRERGSPPSFPLWRTSICRPGPTT